MLPFVVSFIAVVSGFSLFCWGFADTSEVYWKVRATKYIGGIFLMLLGTVVGVLARSAL